MQKGGSNSLHRKMEDCDESFLKSQAGKRRELAMVHKKRSAHLKKDGYFWGAVIVGLTVENNIQCIDNFLTVYFSFFFF